MIAININDFYKYGCPKCGCNSATVPNKDDKGTSIHICLECHSKYIVLDDGVNKSSIAVNTNTKDKDGYNIIEYPELQSHPRKGLPCHEWSPLNRKLNNK